MKRTLFIILVLLITIPIFSQDYSDLIQPGRYNSYPALDGPDQEYYSYNLIEDENSGSYSSGSDCLDFFESYLWRIEGNVLILENLESKYRDSCSDEFEDFGPYTQYFQIVEVQENTIYLQLIQEEIDGTVNTISDSEIYIWERTE